MQLVIHHPDAVNDPYIIDHGGDLEEAVKQEAGIVASDAGSELLDEGTEAEREQLKARIVAAALRQLRSPGDSYTDPAGIRWSLTD